MDISRGLRRYVKLLEFNVHDLTALMAVPGLKLVNSMGN